ncbi:MAG: BrnA antitoxin family protein [Deltaproteobacteria bacterium]|nr:BrnA antitoxin family protein [Deltaproteobacteria bacterium]
MKKEYDFTGGVRGKFHRPKKLQRTLRIDADILEYFERMSRAAGIPYQTLINLSLRKFANEDGTITLSGSKK